MMVLSTYLFHGLICSLKVSHIVLSNSAINKPASFFTMCICNYSIFYRYCNVIVTL